MATRLPLYRGFSTQNFLENKTLMMTNQELVKRDLLNYIYTIRGERVHLPDYGTRIPLLAFEPLDSRTLDVVREDLTKAVQYDPRLRLVDLAVMAAPDNNAIFAYVDLEYIELNQVETLKLEFDIGS